MIIEPFDLRQPTRYDLVVDRLTHWYTTSREWIKKAILTDGLYVFNNPWAIQSMEKHTSYCAMIRLGMPIPATAMVPPKQYEPKADLEVTLARYARLFDLGEVGQQVGYPLFVKPYDGGGWAGVRRIVDDETSCTAPTTRAEPTCCTCNRRSSRTTCSSAASASVRRPGSSATTRRRRCTTATRCDDGGVSDGGAPDPRRHDADDQLVLRLGVQLVRGAAPERRVAADRLRQRLPRLAGDVVALPLPVARRRQPALVDLLRGDEAADAGQPRLVAVLRDRRLRRALRRQAGGLRGDRPPALPGRRVRGVLRHPPLPPRRTSCGSSSATASPTAPSARRWRRCYPAHEVDCFTDLFWERIQRWRQHNPPTPRPEARPAGTPSLAAESEL